MNDDSQHKDQTLDTIGGNADIWSESENLLKKINLILKENKNEWRFRNSLALLNSEPLPLICTSLLLLLKKHVQSLTSEDAAIFKSCIHFIEHRVRSERYLDLAKQLNLRTRIWNASLRNKLLSCCLIGVPQLKLILDTLEWHADRDVKMDIFPCGEWAFNEPCIVCLESVFCFSRVCCNSRICEECLSMYLTTRLDEGVLHMECPALHCRGNLARAEIAERLSKENYCKYIRFLAEANADPYSKTCPQCNELSSINKESFENLSKKLKYKIEINCARCGFCWCFRCHSPLHPSIPCKDFLKGHIMLKKWAKQRQGKSDRLNAQKCPKCKIFIQLIDGCDHMICSRCSTTFCYKCGQRLRHLRCIGTHNWRFSIFGCSEILLPNRPHVRRMLRVTFSSIFLLSTLVAALILLPIALPIALVVGLILMPIKSIIRAAHKAIIRRRDFHLEVAHERRRRQISLKILDGDDGSLISMYEFVRMCNENLRTMHNTRHQAKYELQNTHFPTRHIAPETLQVEEFNETTAVLIDQAQSDSSRKQTILADVHLNIATDGEPPIK